MNTLFSLKSLSSLSAAAICREFRENPLFFFCNKNTLSQFPPEVNLSGADFTIT